MVNSWGETVTLVDLDSIAKDRHGPLIERIRPVAEALFSIEDFQLRDISDTSPAPPRTRVISLRRGGEPGLVLEGSRHVKVSYDDPTSETASAMVLGAVAGPGNPIAADPETISLFVLAERLASSDIPVLINGPTGTGKEVLSRFIHDHSDRRDGPFIAINCAALPESMLEAMLFGHQKGSFTGANQASEGFMRAADGGTLLLDEIAEMPLPLQAKLLRALQEREVVPLGSTTPVRIDTRVIACANRDLPVEVEEGRFRADLYYRLNVFPLTIRSLRERPADIAPLACAMIMRHSAELKRIPAFSQVALDLLCTHSWPGNVRELENVVRRALLLAGDDTRIEAEHIIFDGAARLVHSDPVAPDQLPARKPFAGGGSRKLSSIVRDSEAQAILETLEAHDGNRLRTAKALGISERTLRYRLASFREAGIEIGRSAAGGSR